MLFLLTQVDICRSSSLFNCFVNSVVCINHSQSRSTSWCGCVGSQIGQWSHKFMWSSNILANWTTALCSIRTMTNPPDANASLRTHPILKPHMTGFVHFSTEIVCFQNFHCHKQHQKVVSPLLFSVYQEVGFVVTGCISQLSTAGAKYLTSTYRRGGFCLGLLFWRFQSIAGWLLTRSNMVEWHGEGRWSTHGIPESESTEGAQCLEYWQIAHLRANERKTAPCCSWKPFLLFGFISVESWPLYPSSITSGIGTWFSQQLLIGYTGCGQADNTPVKLWCPRDIPEGVVLPTSASTLSSARNPSQLKALTLTSGS